MPEKVKNPWLRGICHSTTMDIDNKTLISLSEIGLTEFDPSINDYLIKNNLTKKGFDLISDAIIIGTEYVFNNSRISFLNQSQITKINEIIIRFTNKPEINISNNEIDLNFQGELPLIRSITSYLDPDIESPPQTHIKHIEVLKQGIDIVVIPLSCRN